MTISYRALVVQHTYGHPVDMAWVSDHRAGFLEIERGRDE